MTLSASLVKCKWVSSVFSALTFIEMLTKLTVRTAPHHERNQYRGEVAAVLTVLNICNRTGARLYILILNKQDEREQSV
jgi:hypothetical protein